MDCYIDAVCGGGTVQNAECFSIYSIRCAYTSIIYTVIMRFLTQHNYIATAFVIIWINLPHGLYYEIVYAAVQDDSQIVFGAI